MTSRTTRALAACAAVAALVATTAASGDTAAQATTDEVITTAAQLPDEILAQLPADAFEAGLDYAPQLVSVRTPTLEDRSAVAASGLDVTEHAGDGFVEVVLYSTADEAVLDELGYAWEVVTPDLIALETQRILADAEYHRSFRAAGTLTALPSGRTTYRVLADFGTEIDQLVADNPGLAKRISLGKSVEGRDLTGIEIGEGVDGPDDGRPVLLMFGNHHAREWPSAEAPMEFAHDLLQRYAEGEARARDLLSRARVIIVPVSNPDGFDASRTSGDLIDLNTVEGGGTVSILATPGNAYKRKNCRFVDGQTQPAGFCVLASSPGGFGIGVDLNRNYGALWGGPGAEGAPNTASPVYRGPAPFSEPETQAIRQLISTRQVTTLISNHTFSNLLLRPVGVVPTTEGPDGFPVGFAPDECFTDDSGQQAGMQALGERMTAQTGYSNQFGWELYDTTGTTEDYSYNATGGYGYTFEIGPDQFHPPFEEFVAEYIGDTAAADSVEPAFVSELTTIAGRECDGDPVDHDVVGGGLSEAYWIALENAADTATHSVISGEAPAGAEITVTRAGTFPLWDGTPFEDTVSTTMQVGQDGTFDYHVNPSTRPFVASRPYTEELFEEYPTTPVTTTEEGGTPADSTPTRDVAIDVPAGADSVIVQMSATNPADDWDLELISPDLVVLDSSATGSSDERVVFQRKSGIRPGQYVARVTNFSATGPYTLAIEVGTIADDEQRPDELFTAGATEAWTVTCALDGTTLAEREVVVDRGDTTDLGEFCVETASGSGVRPAPSTGGTRALPETGGGAILAGALALAGSAALRRRRDA
ncbi:MAG: M14 family metallopeptidase [Actinomycetes bacterium]